MADESRREAWAGRMASLILTVVMLNLVITCVHLFARL